MSITHVVFDVGGIIVDEARTWRGWAAVVGLPEADFLDALRDGIAAGEGIGGTVRRLRPGLDIAAHRRELAALEIPGEGDLYPDVRPAFAALRAMGLRLGIAGNQPRGVAAALHGLGLGAEWVSNSAEWGVKKPDAAFFARVAEACAAPPHRIAYVGDRLDNDARPARAAGMQAVLLPRGLWAHASGPADIAALTELPAYIGQLSTKLAATSAVGTGRGEGPVGTARVSAPPTR
ncbi:HAD family hydrolase [Roseococcus sp. DSY-14]|uniref:HAD family hydrolase n=1 Tax=Roseococcus sp. DSY-14 TaxID=3369650 RepID=UPI00387AF0BC